MKKIATIFLTTICLSIGLTNLVSAEAYPDFPGRIEAEANLYQKYLDLKNGWIKDANTINNTYSNSYEVQKTINDYLTSVQNKMFSTYKTTEGYDIDKYFASMNLVKKAYKDNLTNFDNLDKPVVGELNTLDKVSLNKYVSLYLEKQGLTQILMTYFPLFNPITNPVFMD